MNKIFFVVHGNRHLLPLCLWVSNYCPEASNYRPICILPVLSKVAKKVVVKQLTHCLDISNVGLHPVHFGFWSNNSTETATLHLIEQKILIRQRRGGWCSFFGYEEAIWQKIVMFILKWMSSYLSDRSQCVKVNIVLINNNSFYLSNPFILWLGAQ